MTISKFHHYDEKKKNSKYQPSTSAQAHTHGLKKRLKFMVIFVFFGKQEAIYEEVTTLNFYRKLFYLPSRSFSQVDPSNRDVPGSQPSKVKVHRVWVTSIHVTFDPIMLFPCVKRINTSCLRPLYSYAVILSCSLCVNRSLYAYRTILTDWIQYIFPFVFYDEIADTYKRHSYLSWSSCDNNVLIPNVKRNA